MTKRQRECEYEGCKGWYVPTKNSQKFCCKYCSVTHLNETRYVEQPTISFAPEPPIFGKVLPEFSLAQKTCYNADSLPNVEDLPAAYLKRAHDYWVGLVGGDDTIRIA